MSISGSFNSNANIVGTPENVYRWPVSIMVQVFYCLPGLGLAWSLSLLHLAWRVTHGAPRMGITRREALCMAVPTLSAAALFVAFAS